MATGMSDDAWPDLQKYDIIHSSDEQYLVLNLAGQGSFGKVAKCINLRTARTVAVKIQKKLSNYYDEVQMLYAIRHLDTEKTNLVQILDIFTYKDMYCIVFEMLDTNLWNMVGEKNAFSLSEIRVITHQLLVAFKALKKKGIIHTDLKPDNVMLVNHEDQPFKVKLIDFGLAMKASDVEIGTRMQNLAYRAPEVTLGLPITEAIDMWALGCVLAYLFFGRNIFPSTCEYSKMKDLCKLLGQPADNLLDAGILTNRFFTKEKGTCNPQWRLKTPKEYMDKTGKQIKSQKSFFDPARNLKEAVKLFSKDDCHDEDTMAFVDLLEQLLDHDANTRITPSQALKHRFVTMTHLKKDFNTSYADSAYELMAACSLGDSNDSSDGYSSTDDLTSVSQLKVDDIFCNGPKEYCIVDIPRKGRFGCVEKKTSEKVAIRILGESKKQLKIFKKISALDPEKTNMVRVMNCFMLGGMYFVMFEMLDISISDFMLKRQASLSLNEICLITKQLLVALEALKTLGIIHADVNPDNVMLVNHKEQPFKVKLGDLGLAMKASDVEIGMKLQNLAYRAPEEMLGLPITEVIDMWALGCVLAYLFFGRNIFPPECEYSRMKDLCKLLGQPADYLLDAGILTKKYFTKEKGTCNPQWRLKTPQDYMDKTGNQIKSQKCCLDTARNLKEAVKLFSKDDGHDEDGIMAFVDLLQQLLDYDANTRITPSQALKHRFVTMTHPC